MLSIADKLTCPLCKKWVSADLITDSLVMGSVECCTDCYRELLMASDKLPESWKYRILDELGILDNFEEE